MSTHRVIPAARVSTTTELNVDNLFISPSSGLLYTEWINALQNAAVDNVQTVQIMRVLRNRLLGHEALKLYFVQKAGLVGVLTRFTDAAALPAVQREAIIILGSIAHGGARELEALLWHNIPQLLLEVVRRVDVGSEEGKKLAEAGLRALRIIYRHTSTPRELPFRPEYLGTLLQLLESTELGRIREYCAVLVANCCDQTDKQTLLCEKGVPQVAVKMALSSRGAPYSLLEASLDLIAALTRDNPEGVVQISHETALVTMLFDLLQRKSTAEIRIFAALCLANIFRREETTTDPRIVTILLPSLSILMADDSPVRSRAAEVLALLLTDSETLQVAACDADVISRLAAMLKTPRNESESEAALLALAVVASYKEECRRLVIDAKVLSSILTSMESSNVGVRSAACQCTRSLSRSVKNLRTSLVDAGMASPLLRLLDDSSSLVQKTACAALCNLVLDFSPMKETVLKEGGVRRLVELVGSSDSDLRYNALWALKNLLYLADTPIKTATMQLITYPRLQQLANDSALLVQEQALNLIRNLVCEKEQDVNEVLSSFGQESLIKLLEAKMASPKEEILVHSLYIVANSCTAASAVPKEAALESDVIMKKVASLLQPGQSSQLQLAALWCVINLTWTDDTGSTERINKLRGLGIERMLQGLLRAGLAHDVRDRVQTALDNFSALDPPRARPENRRTN